MADTGVAVNFPSLPEFESRRTITDSTSGKDTKTETLSPEQIAARDVQHAQTAEEIAFTDQQKEQKRKEAEAERQNVEAAQFAADAEEQLRTGPQAQKAKEYVDWARQHTRQEEDRLAKMPAPALFADRDGWSSVRLAVSLGLAGLGDGMVAAAAIRAGHAPTNRNTVGEIIDRDLNRQRAAIDKQKDSVLIARTGIKDAEEARRAVMADLELKGKHMYRQAELLTRARLAALKIDQATIDQTKEILELKRKQADHDAEYVKGHSTNVTSRWDSAKTTNETINRTPAALGAKGGGTEADQHAAQFDILKQHGEWIARAMPDLSSEDIEAVNTASAAADAAKGRPLLSLVAAKLGVDAETGISSRAKEFIDHMERGNKAIARLESGAAIGKEEALDFRDKMRPRVSDQRPDRVMRSNNLLSDIGAWGAHIARPPKNGSPEAPKSEFTPQRVARAKAIATDKNRARADRDEARKFIKAASDAGVN